MPRPHKPAESPIAPALLRWFRTHGRHDLPWQRRRSPYRVWLSEIMLQQTRVAAVVPYYRKFLARFPSLQALADAPLDEVLALWSGLGYYARARNLHRAARMIRDEFGGRFPRGFAQVAALPGIGRSTAGAILALARAERHAILDGNVKRVLTRYHGIRGWPGERKVEDKLWALAESHTPRAHLADYTQAIMDLGATLCTRRKPRCAACPLAPGCRAHALGRETAFPSPRPQRAKPRRRTCMLLIVCDGRVLLMRRPPAGVWGGMWSFPAIPARAAAADWCRRETGATPRQQRRWPVFRHSFSHFRLDIEPVELEIAHAARVNDNDDRCWVELAGEPRFGLAAPVRKLLGQLRRLQEESRHDTHGQMRLAG